MKVRKPTITTRETCGQELRLILDKDVGAPAGSYRRVVLMTPPSPVMNVSIDQPTPTQIAGGRGYMVPRFSPDTSFSFCLQPDQQVYAMATEGFGSISIICEYLE